ncbi:MAG: hypothetical protein WC455_20465 [Dehalococcoidia bacterium]|jgi:hypothetical protein
MRLLSPSELRRAIARNDAGQGMDDIASLYHMDCSHLSAQMNAWRVLHSHKKPFGVQSKCMRERRPAT